MQLQHFGKTYTLARSKWTVLSTIEEWIEKWFLEVVGEEKVNEQPILQRLRAEFETMKTQNNSGSEYAQWIISTCDYMLEILNKLKKEETPKEVFEYIDKTQREKETQTEEKCPDCNWWGKEICNNPDHSFIEAMPWDTGRLWCPCCGTDEHYRIMSSDCVKCKWTGKHTRTIQWIEKVDNFDWKAQAIDSVTKAMWHGFDSEQWERFVQMILSHK